MNDQPRLPELDERQALAVGAVVDGTADADERALVDASPALQAWVDEQRRVIAELQDVSVPPPSRDLAISAALAAFDELHRAGSTVASDPPVSAPVVSLADRARRRWNPRAVLGAAAAVVAVLAIGGVIVSNGDDDDATSSGADATVLDADQKIADAETELAADQAAGGSPQAPAPASAQTISEIPGPGEVVTNAAPADAGAADTAAPAATEAPAESIAAEQTDAPEETTAGDTFATPLAESVADPDALIAYVQRIDAERDSATPGAIVPATTAPASSCVNVGDDVLGHVVYGPDSVAAVVLRDVSTGEVRAEALDTCQVLVTVTIPD